MDGKLDEALLNAVTKGFSKDIPKLLQKGANPCSLCYSGRSALGAAAQNGNIFILQLLLDACNISEEQLHQKYNRKIRLDQNSTKHSPTSHSNQGYYIVVHDGQEIGDGCTPEGMEALTWDEELEAAEVSSDEDEWISLYRWYARILEQTGSALTFAGTIQNADSLDAFRRAPIHYAAEQGHVDVLRLLIESGVKVDHNELDGPTPLHLAVSNDRIDIVKILLETGAKPNVKTPDKITALHIAATRGFTETAKVLLDAGASVDALDGSERTALMLAVTRGHQRLVNLLLERGARVNAEEIHGYTPLCEAVWRHNYNMVIILLSHGARVTQSHRLLHYCVGAKLPDIALQLIINGSVLNLRDESGDTPLLLAARTAQPHFVKLLLENGALANCRHGLTGSTAIHEALDGCVDQPELFKSILHLLRDYGASLDTKAVCGGETALYKALLMDKNDLAEVLIKEGADVNVCDLQLCVVNNLTLVLRRGNFKLIKLLVYSGFNMSKLLEWFIPCNNNPVDIRNTDSPRDWLYCMATRPLPLQSLCRISIRKHYGPYGKHFNKFYTLGLPKVLINYLFFEDVF